MSNEMLGIISFLRKRYADLFDEELNQETSIEKDLAITGMEAIEFIVDFGIFFNVDVSQFKAADYFEAEGASIFSGWSSRPRKNLTLGHLEKAIQAGRLDEEVINSLIS